MDLRLYDSYNEKLKLCYNLLREDDLNNEEQCEILQEVTYYKACMEDLLKGE